MSSSPVSSDPVVWIKWLRSESIIKYVSKYIRRLVAEGELESGVDVKDAYGKLLIRSSALLKLLPELLSLRPNLDVRDALANAVDLPHPLHEYLSPNEYAKRRGVTRQRIHELMHKSGRYKPVVMPSPKGSRHFKLYHEPSCQRSDQAARDAFMSRFRVEDAEEK